MTSRRKRERDLLEAIGGIREAYIEEALPERIRTGRGRRFFSPTWAGLAAAAVLGFSILLPNINGSVAHAMQGLPLLGPYFSMVTFRTYHLATDKVQADVEVSALAVLPTEEGGDRGEETVQAVNADLERRVDRLMEDFRRQVEAGGYQALHISNEVVTDSEDYYGICLTAYTAAADGYEEEVYYTIDKKTGRLLTLSDLFLEDSPYGEVISENIKGQMRENMKRREDLSYYLDSEEAPEMDFSGIDRDQSFYLAQDGSLVICFQEGEAAPFYMGSLKFVIPGEVLADYRKN